MRRPCRFHRRITATRRAAAPSITARCRGACTRTISAPSHTVALRRLGHSGRLLCLADWPLSHADLEPFYDRAEYDLGVSGKAGNLQGKKIDGGNVFEAPRAAISRRRCGSTRAPRCSTPPPASSATTRSPPARHPVGRVSGPPGCTYCGFCQAFGCHVGAKSSILVTKLPEADATGNFRLITGAMCHRVTSDNSGRVTGVNYYGADGSDNTIEAEIVILSTFIYDNTRLLLVSKSGNSPTGSPTRAAKSAAT